MKIAELYRKKNPVVSFEIFPPKPSVPLESIYSTLEQFKSIAPAYISVTYGAGGSQKGRTIEITAKIKQHYGMESMAHLTCVGHSTDEIDQMLDEMHEKGLENILALRGDPPSGQPDFDYSKGSFTYANELIAHIKRKNNFCVAAAAYLEGHIECRRLKDDMMNLRRKVDTGVDFLLTQLFFENKLYYDFTERAAAMGITCPIIPGVMPVLKAEQIKSIAVKSGCSIPARLVIMMDKYQHCPEDLQKAGIEYAAVQVKDLIDNGAPGVHIYTMNKPEPTRQILEYAGFMSVR